MLEPMASETSICVLFLYISFADSNSSVSSDWQRQRCLASFTLNPNLFTLAIGTVVQHFLDITCYRLYTL